jgi:Amt family ammonium transporter
LSGSLDVVGVHLVGGLVGALLLGFFADAAVNPAVKNEGLFTGGDGKLLWFQFVASAATLVFSFVVSFIIAKAIDKAIGLRVTEEEEEEGLDYSQHAETAYSFGSTGTMDRL